MSLVGVAEVADLLGVTKQVIANWRSRRPLFPKPAAELKSGPVWTEESILQWAATQDIAIKLRTVVPAEDETPMRRAVVVAMMNMKGGVGKSTLAANFGWYGAVRRDLRVLLIDLDPQFNLSQYVLGVTKFEELLEKKELTIDAMFKPTVLGKGSVGMDELIQKVNDWDDGSCLHLVPASLELAWSVKHASDRAHVLRDSLEEVINEYDVIIIDCSPTESILTWAAYFAADYIVVPVRPEFLSTIGLPLLLQSLEEFKKTYKNEKYPEIAGIVFNDAGEKSEHEKSRSYVRQLAEKYEIPIFVQELSHSDSYPAGARRGQPILWTDNARDTKKAELTKVANEFYTRIGL